MGARATSTLMHLKAFDSLLSKTLPAVLLFTVISCSAKGQVPMEPERARLLNGLRVLIWSRPADQDVLLKLRVHSGASFDLAGKDGSMALLGDILFPDPTTREYFTDEMQGRLNVTTNYDSLTITMQGRAREFERMVEILRTGLVTTQLTPETVAKVREGRIKVVKDSGISPAMLADRAIASRLFGTFPYGRPYGGTVESLERVDRNDLMLARDRFLNPNNATLTIIGGIQSNRALRALRQLLGIWRKAEKLVPATFRQPALPDSRTLIINAPADQGVEVRLAVRGLSRQDPDTPAADLLANVVRRRWMKLLPELARSPVYVTHEAFALPGMFVMGASVENVLAGKTLTTAKAAIHSLASSPVTLDELNQAKTEAISQVNNELAKSDGIADAWLDGDTYGLPSVAERLRALSGMTPADLERAATRIVDERGFASVVLGNSAVVKAQLEQFGKVEIMGEIAPATPPISDLKPAPKSDPKTKPQTRAPREP